MEKRLLCAPFLSSFFGVCPTFKSLKMFVKTGTGRIMSRGCRNLLEVPLALSVNFWAEFYGMSLQLFCVGKLKLLTRWLRLLLKDTVSSKRQLWILFLKSLSKTSESFRTTAVWSSFNTWLLLTTEVQVALINKASFFCTVKKEWWFLSRCKQPHREKKCCVRLFLKQRKAVKVDKRRKVLSKVLIPVAPVIINSLCRAHWMCSGVFLWCF